MKTYPCPYCKEPAPNLLKHIAEKCEATEPVRKAKLKVHAHEPQLDRKKT
jgi:hypothetical protein